MDPLQVGIIGCGNISGIYLDNLSNKLPNVKLKACADLDMDRARAKAEEFPGVQAMEVDELLGDPDIRLVVNLTTPGAHYTVCRQAIEAGKCAYVEKPLTLTRQEGRALLDAAAEQKVLLGGAPDTFLGAGIQTCRKLIDDGAIGEPIGAQAFLLCRGHEGWHPDPEFYYQIGGGPMFDMGPYYLTALIALLGPVRRATGSARASFAERVIGSEKKRGQRIAVEVPTHITGVMDFAGGAIGTIVTSFDVWASETPRIEVFGSEASLSVPNPNFFGGPVRIRRKDNAEWEEVPLTHPNAENMRGLGPADLADAFVNDRPARASGELAYHVLDLMHAFHDASEQGRHIELESTCPQPAPMPADGGF